MLKRPTDLLPSPPDYGIDINDIASHHSLPDMIHRFPTAAEYERLHRKRRETRKRRIVVAVCVLVAAVFIAAFFPNRSSGSTYGSAADSVIEHSEYTVVSATYLDEIQADLVVYFHKKTLTEVMTLVPDDAQQDSVFGMSFRTLPESDNGAAHVLMRSVLDGSKKFPLKDPFEELRRGSLQTYLKQFVFGDRTVYACASRNSKDFANIIDVYLDAVFNPNVVSDSGNWIFRQEAWRLEKYGHSNPHSNDQTHHFNGAALQIQKGAYSDPDVSIHKYAHRALFADTQYKYDNSGTPAGILTLTRNGLIDYHKKYYHPTNAQIFLYGNVGDVNEGMNQVDDYISAYEAQQDIRDQSVPQWQNKVFQDAPRELHDYASSVANGDHHVMMSWLINENQLDAKTEIAWRMLNYLLIQSPTSILRKVLEYSGAGREVIGGGLKSDLLQWTFNVGMKGVRSDDVETVEDIITDALNEILQNGGFNDEELQAAFNSVEFQLTDHATGIVPRGISFMFAAFAKWTYDGHLPADAFQFSSGIDEIINEVSKNGNQLFTTLIKENLIENNQKVIVELSPDTKYVVKQLKGDQDRVDLLRQSLSDQEFFAIVDETGEMSLKQKMDDPPAVVDTIPHLAISDIEPKTRANTIKLSIAENILVAETNIESSFGILYIDFGLDLGNLDFPDLHLLPLLSRLFLETGTKLWTEDQVSNAIGKSSGGIYSKILVEGVRAKGSDWASFVVTDESHFVTKLFFRGKCLAENLPQYFELLAQIIWYGADLNQARTIEIMDDMIEKLTELIGKSGDDFVARRIEARYSNYGFIRERLEGITNLQMLNDARNTAVNDWANFKNRLNTMRKTIVEGHRNGMVLSMTGEQDRLISAKSVISSFLKDTVPDNKSATPFSHPSIDEHPWVPIIRNAGLSPKSNEGIEYPLPISHVGKGAKLYEVWEAIDGAASVVSKYLEDGYLREMITLQGGAASVHCHIDFQSGTLKLFSYRDPHIAKTLDVFNKASVVLGERVLTSDTLPAEAIHAVIGTIAELDGSSPQPDKIGWDFLIEYMREETSDVRQLWRDQILNTSHIDFVEYIEHLANWAQPTIAVIASNEAIQDANTTRGIELQQVKILV